jgi:hypothetical protein
LSLVRLVIRAVTGSCFQSKLYPKEAQKETSARGQVEDNFPVLAAIRFHRVHWSDDMPLRPAQSLVSESFPRSMAQWTLREMSCCMDALQMLEIQLSASDKNSPWQNSYKAQYFRKLRKFANHE